MNAYLPCSEVQNGQIVRGRSIREDCVVGVVVLVSLVVGCRSHGSNSRVVCDDDGRRGAHTIREEGIGGDEGQSEWERRSSALVFERRQELGKTRCRYNVETG